jgi:hypothetical protein
LEQEICRSKFVIDEARFNASRKFVALRWSDRNGSSAGKSPSHHTSTRCSRTGSRSVPDGASARSTAAQTFVDGGEWAIRVPLYAAVNADGNLVGGLSVNWDSIEDDVVGTVFFGKKFELFGD